MEPFWGVIRRILVYLEIKDVFVACNCNRPVWGAYGSTVYQNTIRWWISEKAFPFRHNIKATIVNLRTAHLALQSPLKPRHITYCCGHQCALVLFRFIAARKPVPLPSAQLWIVVCADECISHVDSDHWPLESLLLQNVSTHLERFYLLCILFLRGCLRWLLCVIGWTINFVTSLCAN